MERLRTEIIDEYFFGTSVRDDKGNIFPAPADAVAKFEELKKTWLEIQPESDTEKPSVALYPVYEGPKQGYRVVTQITYKP